MRYLPIIVKAMAAVMVLIVAVVAWFGYQLQQFRHQAFDISEPGSVVIDPGTSLWGVARELSNAGLIDDARQFVWLGRWLGQDQSIKAGEYAVEPGMTAEILLARMVKGDVIQHTLTVVEGWTFAQMLAEVRSHEQLENTLADLTGADIMARLGRPELHPEGMFYPDTYHFPTGTTDLEFLNRALLAMESHLEQAWSQKNEGLPYKNAYEALIMASIIEKETGLAHERGEIAGVFVRRLLKRMRLQTDPTVIYGMGSDFDGNIRRRDLRRDTPYNTYTRHGLPPTPIALPGLDSIRAALDPKPGETLYFVATGDGGHYFSKTLAEHQQAVIEYQIKPRRNGG